MSHVTVEEVTDERWINAVHVSNGTIELLAPTTVGPRIARFGFEGARNEFRVFPEPREEWPLVGGHRLWHGPEYAPRTHQPDLEPIDAEVIDDGVALRRGADKGTGIEKAITVRMGSGASVEITHELTNRGVWPVEFAPWGLSVLKPGGTAVIPLSPQAEEDSLLPDRSITFWPYTTPGDNRLAYGEERVLVAQETDSDGPLKIGTSAGDAWVAYVNDGHAFRKDVSVDPAGTYPDRGCGAEVYTDGEILELETLGPLRTVEPGEAVEHVETWTLAKGVPRGDRHLARRHLSRPADRQPPILTVG
ncbi:hypothetical protein HLRTI_002419 [Halorhabdus tiamatea SARL4B]|uniref:DUF4380 domain-containing protein n=1 Tax=Halorhabdus tiamatea SARL4B TaxID=1033806 RepID=F7PHK8_9EURY|nr:hypothetical protein [Halorhabdus tiamatea]ERJ05609.1 hypothetical protein HLRTI_002419 [Halorhabdus tiamatea SARL4B]CCQ34998.1 conserved hypothetical protein (DUF4380) [Halorhabdus tiamatea SARL4B]